MERTVNGQGDSNNFAVVSSHDTSSEHDPHFEPIVTLPEVVVNTLEENEEELIKLRAKLFRYDTSESPPEWKERGTGEVKLLHNEERNTVRVVMRRDKTLKLCANHFVAPWMELKPNCGSDRAWVWSVSGDFTEDTPRNELLAIRFANSENAMKWKDKFEEAKLLVADGPTVHGEDSDDEGDQEESATESDSGDSDDQTNAQEPEDSVSKDLEKLTITGQDDTGKNIPDKNIEATEKKNLIDSNTEPEEQNKENCSEKVEV